MNTINQEKNISVVIPTCNRFDLLQHCLNQLKPGAQTLDFANYEVIVSDDGTNSVKELLEANYSWVKWIQGPKKGPASNRNNGARVAGGRWLVFFDDDCIPDLDILLNYYQQIISEKYDVIEGLIYSDEVIKPFYTAPLNLKGGHLWSCNFAIDKDVFWSIGGFDEKFRYPNMEDIDLCTRLQKGNRRFIFSEKTKVYHPQRPIAKPAQYARYHESWMYYHYKHGSPKSMRELLVTIIKVRVRYIFIRNFGIYSIKGVALLIQELYLTIKNSFKWNFKKEFQHVK